MSDANTAPPAIDGDLSAALAGTPDGVQVVIKLANGRKFKHAMLRLRAASAEEEILTLPEKSGAPKLDGTRDMRWVSADWSDERAIVAIDMSASLPASGARGVRIRAQSVGNWRPLAPFDTVVFEKQSAPSESSKLKQITPKTGTAPPEKLYLSARFPAFAASRFNLEMLAENQIDNKPTGVLIPGPVKVDAVLVTATRQPCHVSVAVGDDLPFFTSQGPLPVAPVVVDGLVRALNRYLVDNPDALRIPLIVRSAGSGNILLDRFDAQQDEPVPDTPADGGSDDGDSGPVVPPRDETGYLQPVVAAQHQNAQLCRPQYVVAQGFKALPAGMALSSFAAFLRFSPGVKGTLGFYPDNKGRPADTPFEPAVDLAFAPLNEGKESWLVHYLKQVLRLPPQPWWAVLTITGGEALWYVSEQVPASAANVMYQVAGGAWMPVGSETKSCWAQSMLGIVAVKKE